MPWTSSWGKSADWAPSVFETLGRALFAAQAFEERCRFVLRIRNLAREVEVAPDDPLDALVARVPKDKMLAATIKELQKRGGFREDFVDALKAATEARNYIAHESAHLSPAGRREALVQKIERELRPALRHLAVGDHRVSEVVLAIEDWESTSSIGWIKERYPEILVSWVLFPVKEILEDEGMPPLAYPYADPWQAARHAEDIALAEKCRMERPGVL